MKIVNRYPFEFYGSKLFAYVTDQNEFLLRLLPYWVGTINTARMEPQLKERIIRFKRQFVDVAWAALQVFPIDVWTVVDKPFPPSE